MTDDEIRGLFREMRETPVPADSLVRVRSGLESRMGRRRWWKLAAWVAAPAVVLLAGVVFRPAPVVQRAAPEAVIAHRVDPPQTAVNEMPRTAPRHSIHRARRTLPSPKPTVPIVIEIETPDPDVVIRLIGE
ncbi:MAG: hypothetical protein M3N54_13055 [Acidobacteriota bacterium]|nr:hypothetical protein [Acidobacteriota bacterium]